MKYQVATVSTRNLGTITLAFEFPLVERERERERK
jgi:hypothetical protein